MIAISLEQVSELVILGRVELGGGLSLIEVVAKWYVQATRKDKDQLRRVEKKKSGQVESDRN